MLSQIKVKIFFKGESTFDIFTMETIPHPLDILMIVEKDQTFHIKVLQVCHVAEKPYKESLVKGIDCKMIIWGERIKNGDLFKIY